MKNIILSLLSGLLLALAWPTYGMSLLMFVGFVPLLIAESNIRKQKHTKRKIFALSYLTFLIWNVITTWWIWYSTPIGSVFAIVANSFLMTTTFLIYHIVSKRVSSKLSLIFLPAVWICFEKFHLWWGVSWPWLNLGNAFSEDIGYIQWYEYTGTFGGTLWIWVINILFFVSILNFEQNKNRKQLTVNIAKCVLGIVIPIIISLWMFIKYENHGKPSQVIVLQPNINPYTEKYNISNFEITNLLIELMSQKINQKTDFILTPETVFADNIRREILSTSHEINILRNYLSQYPKVSFVGGISMYEIVTEKNKTTSQSNYVPNKNFWFNDYNSAFFLNNYTDSIALYHKSKLVVGVENLPYQNIIKPILGDVMINLGGTVALKTTQNERSVFRNFEGKSVAPVICYESVYGEFVTEYIQKGGQFIGIITNDAWWGNTQGHKQLLSYARLRAIETRKSIARSANTGISAFINQKGQITQSLAYEKQGSLKDTILLNDTITFYTRFGDYIARISIFIAFGIFLLAFTRRKTTF